MLMKMRSKMQNQKGFTLVELMVVVVILGILVAIAVPIYNSVTEKAELSSIEANLRTIDGAVMMYESTDEAKAADNKDVLNGYIQTWPTSPGKYKLVGGVATVTISADREGGLTTGDHTLAEILGS